MMLLKLFCIAASFCTFIPGANSYGECSYADCIFQGIKPRRSETDYYLVMLNIDQIPHNSIQRCPNMLARIRQCRSERRECYTSVETPWRRRLLDDRYVMFLMDVAYFACSRPKKAVALKGCIHSRLPRQLKTCMERAPYFDFECIKKQYNENNNCPGGIDLYFLQLVERLSTNPYIR